MPKPEHILGLNARRKQYMSLNPSSAKQICNSKLLTKQVLTQNNVPHPKLYAQFTDMDQVRNFDFTNITGSFVIKPSGGSGGKGILIIKKRLKNQKVWLDINNNQLQEQDIELHLSDILEGQYSTFSRQHQAFVEERVPIHKKFKKYVYAGTPDIRVIVYNQVPVMAMLRLPTKESEGRANLHQGAIGVGIDISTGVTLAGVKNNNLVKYVPDSKIKLNGFKIPYWTSTLRTSIEAVKAAELVFGGVDILMHPEKGPMVVELNASPGLSIQLANNAGLKWRMDRVEGVNIRNSDHGMRVGKALFAESFSDKVKADEGISIVNNFETVRLINKNRLIDTEAILSTDAYRSQIQRDVAESLDLLRNETILWERKRGRITQQVVEVTLVLKGKRIKSNMSVVREVKGDCKVLIGRLDLQGFLVNPQLRREL